MTLEEAIVDLLAKPKVLLGVDFDGTLSELVDDPDDATLHEHARRHLVALASRDSVDVLVLSGRGHADLSARIGDLTGATLIGEHGNDMGLDHEPADLEDLDDILTTIQQRTPGSRVERKPNSRAFHTRTSPASAAAEANRELVDWAATRGDVRLLAGKDIVELTVASRTKGDVISEAFRRYDGVIYIGDDTTDETVFEVLRDVDIGIKVGDGDTAAGYRLADVTAVAELLGNMATTEGDDESS